MNSARTFALVLILSAGLLPGAPSLCVRVADPQQAAVPGVEIRIRSAEQSTVLGQTDIKGLLCFEASLPLEIVVEPTGFEPLTARIETQPDSPVVLRLRPAVVRTAITVTTGSDPLPMLETRSVEIERHGARTVLDAIDRLVPGAFVTRRGVMGYGIATNGTGGLSIRGVGGQPNTGVLVVVDGRPDFQGMMGHPLPDFYSLSDAGTVSVVQGPASVLYGSNAMGGVIEVIPERPAEGTFTRLTTSLGSFTTGQHRLSHGTSTGRSYYSFNAGVSHTAGDRPSSAFRDQNGNLSLGRDFSGRWRASLHGRYGHFHVEDPGPLSGPLSNSYARVGRGGASLNLDNNSSRTWGHARFYSSHGKHYITDGFRSVDRTTGLRLQQDFAATEGVTLTTGSDIVSYGGRARNLLQSVNYGSHSLITTAVFSRARWVANNRVTLHSGLRYDHNSTVGSIVAPEAGLSLRLAAKYIASFEVGRGFRNPTIRELYLFPAPNPLLKPERLWNYQASLRAQPARYLSASATIYYSDLANMIVTTGRFPAIQLSNSGRALNRGGEGMVQWRPNRRLSFHTGYAYLNSTNPAPYIPKNKLNYGLTWDTGHASVRFDATSLGKRWGDAARTRQLEGATIGTLHLNVPIRSGWNVFTMIDNLFDRQYQIVTGYPMPGINAAGGLSVRF